MGCDGGTIPKRKEIVKNKDHRPREERGRGSNAADRWKYCAASRLPLTKPIVAGNCGHLFSKEAIIEFLLDLKTNPQKARDLREEVAPALNTIRNLKDVKELKLKDNPTWETHMSGDKPSSSQDTGSIGRWICPITGLETNGKYKFLFSWNCGCLVSGRAINQVPNDDKCIVCQKSYQDHDLVLINPQTLEEIERNEARFTSRRLGPAAPKVESRSSETSVGSSSRRHEKNGVPTTSFGHEHRNHSSSRPSDSKEPSTRSNGESYRYEHQNSHSRHSSSHSDHSSKRHKSRH